MPPETEISTTVKSVDDSESVNVRVAVSPAFKEETSELTAIVGGVLSRLNTRTWPEWSPLHQDKQKIITPSQ